MPAAAPVLGVVHRDGHHRRRGRHRRLRLVHERDQEGDRAPRSRRLARRSTRSTSMAAGARRRHAEGDHRGARRLALGRGLRLFGAPGANAIVHIVPGASPTATVYKLGAGERAAGGRHRTAKGNVWFSGAPRGGAGGRPTRPASPAAPLDRSRRRSTRRRRRRRRADQATRSTTRRPRRSRRRDDAHAVDGRARRRSPTRRSEATRSPPTRSASARREDRCSLVYLIQTHEYVKGFPNTHGYAGEGRRS